MRAARPVQVGRQPAARHVQGLPEQGRRHLHDLPQGRDAGPGKGRDRDPGPAGAAGRHEPDVPGRRTAAARTRPSKATRFSRSPSASSASRRTGGPSPSSTGSTTRCGFAPGTTLLIPSAADARAGAPDAMAVETPAAQRHIEVDGGRAAAGLRRPGRERRRHRSARDAGHVRARASAIRAGTFLVGPASRSARRSRSRRPRRRGRPAATIIDGEITSIEADYDTLGARAVVRGYDLSHRLNAGPQDEDVQEHEGYSDIAKQIAGAAGLQADVDDSGRADDHVLQPNLSDLDFLYSLAREHRIRLPRRGPTPCRSRSRPSRRRRRPRARSARRPPTQLVWTEQPPRVPGPDQRRGPGQGRQVRGWDVDEEGGRHRLGAGGRRPPRICR